MTSTSSSIAAADVVAGDHDGRVPIGHAASTGLPVDYVARTERRLCNGIIIGATGSGTTTLAEHIADTLRGTGAWLVRHVRADAGRDRANELYLLTEAEHRSARPGRQREPLHLVIWDGFAQLAADPAADFVGRVSELAQHGPAYGVAQLVIANPDQLHTETATDVDTNTRLRALLSDSLLPPRLPETPPQVRVSCPRRPPGTRRSGRLPAPPGALPPRTAGPGRPGSGRPVAPSSSGCHRRFLRGQTRMKRALPGTLTRDKRARWRCPRWLHEERRISTSGFLLV